MMRYLIRRILLAVPTLLIISLITFAMSRIRDEDPVHIDFDRDPAAYRARAIMLGLDQPNFYCTFTSLAMPDTVFRVLPVEYRRKLERFTLDNGDWPGSQQLLRAIDTAWFQVQQQAAGPVLDAFARLHHCQTFGQVPVDLEIAGRCVDTMGNAPVRTMLQAQIGAMGAIYADLAQHRQRWKNWVPALYWHGFRNQYHAWLAGFLSGDPGTSRITGNSILVELRPRMLISLLLNGAAMFLAYLFGIPLGVFMARYAHRPVEQGTRIGILFLYAMPLMWLGSLLTLLLSRHDIGLGLFNGLNAEPWMMSSKPFWQWVTDNLEKFILPVLTLTLHTLAVLAMQMRGGILEIMQQDFIRTARAKGLSEQLVFWRHAFRNGLFPVITIFASLFPVLISGSLVVEYLFDFPGMGIKMESAFANNDYPVLFAMVMFISLLTIIGSLVADLLYAWVDPRVRFA